MASFKIIIEGNSHEGIYHWEIQSQNDSKHQNNTDFDVMRSIYSFIGMAVNQTDNFLLKQNEQKGD